MRNAIFFDLDGTLTDSGPGIMNSALPALEHFGIPVANRDQLRVFVGPPLRQTFARFGVPEAGIEEAIRIFRARYIPIGKFENTPYPGIADLLARLQAEGFSLYVATSKPQVTAIEVLEHFQLAHHFTLICGADPAVGRETKADVIAHLLAQIGDPGRAVMVGDTDYDVLGAKD
ncbi:MAG: HAD hydrolase-like protein, partial [Evtepia sp.]